jgi:hypothetical protein
MRCWYRPIVFLLAAWGGAFPPATRAAEPARHAQPVTLRGFAFRNAPWRTVLVWLSDQVDLPIICHVMSQGKFTYQPKGPARRYPLSEVLKILNQSLVRQNLRLARREHYLFLTETDTTPDPSCPPERVRPEHLEWYTDTEWVRVTFTLRA